MLDHFSLDAQDGQNYLEVSPRLSRETLPLTPWLEILYIVGKAQLHMPIATNPKIASGAKIKHTSGRHIGTLRAIMRSPREDQPGLMYIAILNLFHNYRLVIRCITDMLCFTMCTICCLFNIVVPLCLLSQAVFHTPLCNFIDVTGPEVSSRGRVRLIHEHMQQFPADGPESHVRTVGFELKSGFHKSGPFRGSPLKTFNVLVKEGIFILVSGVF